MRFFDEAKTKNDNKTKANYLKSVYSNGLVFKIPKTKNSNSCFNPNPETLRHSNSLTSIPYLAICHNSSSYTQSSGSSSDSFRC